MDPVLYFLFGSCEFSPLSCQCTFTCFVTRPTISSLNSRLGSRRQVTVPLHPFNNEGTEVKNIYIRNLGRCFFGQKRLKIHIESDRVKRKTFMITSKDLKNFTYTLNDKFEHHNIISSTYKTHY